MNRIPGGAYTVATQLAERGIRHSFASVGEARRRTTAARRVSRVKLANKPELEKAICCRAKIEVETPEQRVERMNQHAGRWHGKTERSEMQLWSDALLTLDYLSEVRRDALVKEWNRSPLPATAEYFLDFLRLSGTPIWCIRAERQVRDGRLSCTLGGLLAGG